MKKYFVTIYSSYTYVYNIVWVEVGGGDRMKKVYKSEQQPKKDSFQFYVYNGDRFLLCGQHLNHRLLRRVLLLRYAMAQDIVLRAIVKRYALGRG